MPARNIDAIDNDAAAFIELVTVDDGAAAFIELFVFNHAVDAFIVFVGDNRYVEVDSIRNAALERSDHSIDAVIVCGDVKRAEVEGQRRLRNS